MHKVTATVSAIVDPEGEATTGHFQYITEKKFKEDGETFGAGTSATPESASIGGAFAEDPASAALGGLEIETANRFRVAATNASGTATGETGAFTTVSPLRVAIRPRPPRLPLPTSAVLQAAINPPGIPRATTLNISPRLLQADGESFSGPDQPVVVPQPDASIDSSESD